MTKRVWHKGPPPHVGWWNASAARKDDVWRWWNGECYRIGWAASMKMRKEGVDAYLADHRKQAKPMVNVDVLVFVGVILLVVALLAFLMGYRDGQADRTAKQSSAEPYSPATKCTSYDIRDGKKYLLTWKRI